MKKERVLIGLLTALTIAIMPFISAQASTRPPREYYFFYVTIVLLAIYFISYILSKKEVISCTTHRKIWNFFLLISFLGTGISGILLVLRASYGIEVNFGFNMTFWHVETGIIMAVISIFHIIWNFSYYRHILSRNTSPGASPRKLKLKLKSR